MAETFAFMIKVDGGEPREFVSRHSEYVVAAMEAFGALGLPYPCTVEIWAPSLVGPDGYGPYHFRIDNFVDVRGLRYSAPAVMTTTGEVPLPREVQRALDTGADTTD